MQGVSLDSFASPVHVEWDSRAALTLLGQLPFFIDSREYPCNLGGAHRARSGEI